MKYLLVLCVAALMLGCSTEGEIKIVNSTNHYIFVDYDNSSYVLEGEDSSSSTLELSVDTGKRFLFWDNEGQEADITIEGETYKMANADDNTTQMIVKPNEVSYAYLNPTHAAVKIFNNAAQEISDFGYYKDDGNFTPIITENIVPGDSLYFHLAPSSQEDVISYRFEYRFEGEADMTSTGVINTLYIDEMFEINVLF